MVNLMNDSALKPGVSGPLIVLAGLTGVLGLTLLKSGMLYNSPTYFLAHGLFFFMFVLFWSAFFPGPMNVSPIGFRKTWVIQSAGRKFGVFLALLWHLGYEFYEDQLDRVVIVFDWDQIASGLVGISLAVLVAKIIERSAELGEQD